MKAEPAINNKWVSIQCVIDLQLLTYTSKVIMSKSKFIKDITGQTFGSLTAIRLDHIGKGSQKKTAFWRYSCSCGKEVILRANTITYTAKKYKDTKPQFPSCGCKELAQKTKHGFRKAKNTHPLYKEYTSMMNRCYNDSCPEYKWYGALGITVCAEWKNNPKAFCEWGLNNGWYKGAHLDKDFLSDKLHISPRIYSPQTCRFVSPKENVGYATNRRNYGKHPNVRLSQQMVNEIIQRYINGKSASRIIKNYPIKNVSSIYRLLKLAGIARRTSEDYCYKQKR